MEKTYIAIDLKSFYASVECVERGLDPLKTNLVVADNSRTEKTICLAVSPSLKKYGISGRARLFEVIQAVKSINKSRLQKAKKFTGKSYDDNELENNPNLELDYIVATPQMARYMEISTKVFGIYMNYVSSEDMHVYSVDEVFIDCTNYLKYYGISARELAMKMILDVLKETGITATAGIGTNMYLCKIAMDVEAKHIAPDKNGVRIAELNEMSYREKMWNHRPLTDFWRIGNGYAKKLEQNGMYTMGDVAQCSVYNEEKLYKMFGINAELLIDHAWGWEPCTIKEVKSYRPSNSSLCSGQVLLSPYTFEKARIVLREMADAMALDLVAKGLTADQLVLTVNYDRENMTNEKIMADYKGEFVVDHYGRTVPKPAHGTGNIGKHTSSARLIINTALKIYDSTVNKNLLIRKLNISANHVLPENETEESFCEQLDMFTDYTKLLEQREKEKEFFQKEKKIQKTTIAIKEKYGKNALLKGVNFSDGATAKERNAQIGGHKA